MTHPIKNGLIVNWDDIIKIWQHGYAQLKADPKDYGVLMSEPELNPKYNREKMIQIMFEEFNVPKYYTERQAKLALYASGRTTGIVLDIGENVSRMVPINDGNCITKAILKLDLGGKDITGYLQKILSKRGYSMTTPTKMEIVKDIKEKLSYVALDYGDECKNEEISGDMEEKYELPDGKIMTIGSERFRCPEILFKPHFIGLESEGIDRLVFESIMKCNVDIRKELYNNIVLCGGSTMCNGIIQRIQHDISSLAPDSMKIRIIAPHDRVYSVWNGGSVLSSLSTFETKWINLNEYDEIGPSIVHRKCT